MRLPSAEAAMVVPQPAQSDATSPPPRGTEKMLPPPSQYATVAPSPEILGLNNRDAEATRVMVLPEGKSRARTALEPSWVLSYTTERPLAESEGASEPSSSMAMRCSSPLAIPRSASSAWLHTAGVHSRLENAMRPRALPAAVEACN